MTHRHRRIVAWAILTIVVLWFFVAPFLVFYDMTPFPNTIEEQASSILFLYVLFFVLTWGCSAFVIYAMVFGWAIERWPRARIVAEIIALIVVVVLFAPWGK